MSKYHVANFFADFLIILMGALLIAMPLLGFDDINYVFFLCFMFYALISYALYILTRRENDYEYLFICLASVLAATAGVLLIDESSTMVLAYSLVGWIAIVAVVKLIKMDYYHDRNNILWFVRTITFVIFLIIGMLTCINLYYNAEVQSIIMGFFIICCGILELFDPIADFMLVKTVKKKTKPFVIKHK